MHKVTEGIGRLKRQHRQIGRSASLNAKGIREMEQVSLIIIPLMNPMHDVCGVEQSVELIPFNTD